MYFKRTSDASFAPDAFITYIVSVSHISSTISTLDMDNANSLLISLEVIAMHVLAAIKVAIGASVESLRPLVNARATPPFSNPSILTPCTPMCCPNKCTWTPASIILNDKSTAYTSSPSTSLYISVTFCSTLMATAAVATGPFARAVSFKS